MEPLFALGHPYLPQLVDVAPLGVLVCDANGVITFVNQQIERIFGYQSSELVGHSVECLLPHSKRDEHVAYRQTFMGERASRIMGMGRELFARHANGSDFPVEIGITTLGESEQVHAVAFIVDISDRRREEVRIRTLMEAMPFGLLMSDENGIILMTNEEADHIFGYERNFLNGLPIEVLVPERLRAGHMSFRKAFSKVPQSRKMGAGRELMAQRKNGLEFPAEIALTPLKDDGKERYLAVVADITQRKQLESLLRQQSLYDSLTSLPNRNLFFDRLDQACTKHIRQKTPFALLMMDLNRFKDVNDTLGHAAGDKVLQQAGQRLANVLRKSDSLARLGGDEFAAILHGVASADDAVVLAEKIVECLHPPIMVEGHALIVGISIGIALCPRDGCDQNRLLAHADHAMYIAKRGVRSIVVDDTPPGIPLPPPQAITTEIEGALSRGELQLFYQPQVDLNSGQLRGVEALVRWVRPGFGIIPPLDFIPAIESSPLIEQFTYQTLDLALAQLQDFERTSEPLSMAVNLSARMLEHEGFVSRMVSKLIEYDVKPGQLILEITETALVLNPMQARRTIDLLGERGVQFSVDDFGAGFTSFKYLKTFQIAEIKIDKEFISAIEPGSFDSHLVKSIVLFCEGLGLRLIAEGIESESDLLHLKQLGCDLGQGYHIARPMPIEEFKRWLASRG